MLKSPQKKVMVQRGEELSDVKSDNASFFVASPTAANGLAQIDAGVLSGTLNDTPHLIGVENISSHPFLVSYHHYRFRLSVLGVYVRTVMGQGKDFVMGSWAEEVDELDTLPK